MTAQAPEVAVVIPAHNPGDYLLESVGSALAQTVTNTEIVVVDDGSSPEAFPELPHDPRLRCIRQGNRGVSVARNNGAAATSAELLAFLDADDRWLPTKLERQLAALAAHPDAIVCFTGYAVIGPHGNRVASGSAGEETDYRRLFVANPLAPSSVVIRRSAFQRSGGFDPFYSVVADFDLWLRLALIGPFVGIPDVLLEYRMAPHGAGQMSSQLLAAYCESLSIYDRHELRARRTGDEDLLALIAAARRSTKQLRAQQAIARFIDSIRHRGAPEWEMGRVSLQISPATCGAYLARAIARKAGLIPPDSGASGRDSAVGGVSERRR